MAKRVLKKKKKIEVRGLKLPNFKTYYRATVIKTVKFQQKDRHVDQWNRMKSPEINPSIWPVDF